MTLLRANVRASPSKLPGKMQASSKIKFEQEGLQVQASDSKTHQQQGPHSGFLMQSLTGAPFRRGTKFDQVDSGIKPAHERTSRRAMRRFGTSARILAKLYTSAGTPKKAAMRFDGSLFRQGTRGYMREDGSTIRCFCEDSSKASMAFSSSSIWRFSISVSMAARRIFGYSALRLVCEIMRQQAGVVELRTGFRRYASKLGQASRSRSSKRAFKCEQAIARTLQQTRPPLRLLNAKLDWGPFSPGQHAVGLREGDSAIQHLGKDSTQRDYRLRCFGDSAFRRGLGKQIDSASGEVSENISLQESRLFGVEAIFRDHHLDSRVEDHIQEICEQARGGFRARRKQAPSASSSKRAFRCKQADSKTIPCNKAPTQASQSGA
ncbi:hypothetical protein HDU97_003594 [Phlyctochytrium planicorne]|nr:hypothetical protein HDU97_003594 [Phlyctochytrium planicorne]